MGNWIMGRLRSANFSILINRKPRGRFGAFRGLRQGDPLSPFLFTLVADGLSRLVDKACENGVVKGFEIGREKIYISSGLSRLSVPERILGILLCFKIFSRARADSCWNRSP